MLACLILIQAEVHFKEIAVGFGEVSDGLVVEHPYLVAAVGIFEVLNEIEQRHIAVWCGQIAFFDIHDLKKSFVREDALIEVGDNGEVSIRSCTAWRIDTSKSSIIYGDSRVSLIIIMKD